MLSYSVQWMHRVHLKQLLAELSVPEWPGAFKYRQTLMVAFRKVLAVTAFLRGGGDFQKAF